VTYEEGSHDPCAQLCVGARTEPGEGEETFG
jgi:hypothetical protein